ncbi:MAG TPA: hypothetical protein VJC21_01575 [Candidatus Nanoarchaeia archaeon]|nr:hypothetical protein [Candidatus Nanoarchaeia archaeon]
MPLITEHSVTLNLPLPKRAVHKKMDIFYNPVMASQRNLTIVFLNVFPKRNMVVADPLAGTGIRTLRFLKELKRGKIKKILVNDLKENFLKTFENNLRKNTLQKAPVHASNKDANLFLLEQEGLDYVDLDPFGSPNPFISAALARLSRGGILAVTATDTAALTGTYPSVTKRKYWATSQRNYLMHETGLRILIRKIQLHGTSFDRALIPKLAYAKDHYFRIFFHVIKGKEQADTIVQQHQYFLFCPGCSSFRASRYNKETCSCGREFLFAGPLWTGPILDHTLVTAMRKANPFPEEAKFLATLAEESQKQCMGFYDLHALARKYKRLPPRTDDVLRELDAVRTHFSLTGIKTEKSVEDVLALFP